MLDRVDAGLDGVLDGLRTVGMRRDLEARRVRDLHHCGDFLGRHLGRAGNAAVGKHRAGRDHLQQVGAAGDGLFRLAAKLRRPARHAQAHARGNVGLRHAGDHEVAAAAGNREVVANDLHARTGDLARR